MSTLKLENGLSVTRPGVACMGKGPLKSVMTHNETTKSQTNTIAGDSLPIHCMSWRSFKIINVQVLLLISTLLLPVISLAQTVVKYRVIGSGENGYRDGGRKTASFSRPMGVLQLNYSGSPCVMISDAGNHLIRLFDILGGAVSSIAGTPGLLVKLCTCNPSTNEFQKNQSTMLHLIL